MSFKKITQGAKALVTAGQIAANIATVPVTKDLTPTLTKQYAKYSKEVRMPETRRQTQKRAGKDMHPTAALDKRTAKRLRKT